MRILLCFSALIVLINGAHAGSGKKLSTSFCGSMLPKSQRVDLFVSDYQGPIRAEQWGSFNGFTPQLRQIELRFHDKSGVVGPFWQRMSSVPNVIQKGQNLIFPLAIKEMTFNLLKANGEPIVMGAYQTQYLNEFMNDQWSNDLELMKVLDHQASLVYYVVADLSGETTEANEMIWLRRDPQTGTRYLIFDGADGTLKVFSNTNCNDLDDTE